MGHPPPPQAAAFERQLSGLTQTEKFAILARMASLQEVQKTLSKQQKQEIHEALEFGKQKVEQERASSEFLFFAEKCWRASGVGENFIAGYHHRKLADLFHRIMAGKCRRAIVSMPPRHTKSQFGSVLFPAWALGKDPTLKIIQASHSEELATIFGRKVRDLLNSKDYQQLFPELKLKSDNKAAGRWATAQGGEYLSIGVGGGLAGRGASIFVIDDPYSEQDVITGNNDVWDKVWDWYVSGPRQRLQPKAAILVIQTRWSKQDLAGKLIASMSKSKHSDTWEVLEFPAILPSGRPLWPEFWTLEELLATKSTIPVARWNAQYMQDPTAESSAILKRADWKVWPHSDPPRFEYRMHSWDTAYGKDQRNDYSAMTDWGIFYLPDDNERLRPQIFLAGAWKDKVEFPDLKKKAQELYRQYKPDTVLIEKKAAGTPLIHELHQIGIPASGYTPNAAGGDKFVRANSISDIFRSGFVWTFDPTHCRWADEVITECAEFGAGEHDDYVDTVTQAMIRFRQGGFLRLTTDEDDDDDGRPKAKANYAWY